MMRRWSSRPDCDRAIPPRNVETAFAEVGYICRVARARGKRGKGLGPWGRLGSLRPELLLRWHLLLGLGRPPSRRVAEQNALQISLSCAVVPQAVKKRSLQSCPEMSESRGSLLVPTLRGRPALEAWTRGKGTGTAWPQALYFQVTSVEPNCNTHCIALHRTAATPH